MLREIYFVCQLKGIRSEERICRNSRRSWEAHARLPTAYKHGGGGTALRGPTPTTRPSSPATSKGFKAITLRLFVAGKGGQVRQAPNATAGRPRKRASKKACATARESNSNPVSLPLVPFHLHLVIARLLCLLVSPPCSVLSLAPGGRRHKQEEGGSPPGSGCRTGSSVRCDRSVCQRAISLPVAYMLD